MMACLMTRRSAKRALDLQTDKFASHQHAWGVEATAEQRQLVYPPDCGPVAKSYHGGLSRTPRFTSSRKGRTCRDSEQRA